MKVKALRTGYLGIQRQRKGTTFKIKDAKQFSHLWMRALDFTPPAPSEKIKNIMGSPEHAARDAEFVPFDRTTHPGAPDDEDDDNDDVEEIDEKPKRKNRSEEVI